GRGERRRPTPTASSKISPALPCSKPGRRPSRWLGRALGSARVEALVGGGDEVHAASADELAAERVGADLERDEDDAAIRLPAVRGVARVGRSRALAGGIGGAARSVAGAVEARAFDTPRHE